MKNKENEPTRFNDVFDHSKEGFDAIGVTKSEFGKAKKMVDKTCCDMGTPEKSIEHWCDVLTKKEMAMLIKEYKHAPLAEDIWNRLDKYMGNKKTSKKQEPADIEERPIVEGMPNKYNDIYLHDVENTADGVGISEAMMERTANRINDLLNAERKLNSTRLTEIVQKNTTHKELALLYSMEILARVYSSRERRSGGDFLDFLINKLGEKNRGDA